MPQSHSNASDVGSEKSTSSSLKSLAQKTGRRVRKAALNVKKIVNKLKPKSRKKQAVALESESVAGDLKGDDFDNGKYDCFISRDILTYVL